MNYDHLNKGRDFLLRHTGHMSQFAGTKRYVFADGKAKGVEAVDFNTGTGFGFTIVPDRGMDIAWTSYRGIPISYIAKCGMVGPNYYEPGGMNWLKGFFAGLLTTCGLTNVGTPCIDDHPGLGKEELGLHGRITYTSAENVCVSQEWKNNTLEMTASGLMREGILHGESLSLTRTIRAAMGENRLRIHDVAVNDSSRPWPFMILYHCNFGYPVLSEKSRLLINSDRTVQSDLGTLDGEPFDKFHEPLPEFRSHVYFFEPRTDEKGFVKIALINDDQELGVYLNYKKAQLPRLTEWKMLTESEYVIGIEPGNCHPIGRIGHKKEGTLEYLKPGETREVDLEIGLLTTKAEIKQFETNQG
jgi:hypothetical protein